MLDIYFHYYLQYIHLFYQNQKTKALPNLMFHVQYRKQKCIYTIWYLLMFLGLKLLKLMMPSK